MITLFKFGGSCPGIWDWLQWGWISLKWIRSSECISFLEEGSLTFQSLKGSDSPGGVNTNSSAPPDLKCFKSNTWPPPPAPLISPSLLDIFRQQILLFFSPTLKIIPVPSIAFGHCPGSLHLQLTSLKELPAHWEFSLCSLRHPFRTVLLTDPRGGLCGPELPWPGSSTDRGLHLASRCCAHLSGLCFSLLCWVLLSSPTSKLGMHQHMEFGPLFSSHLRPWWPHPAPWF